MKKRELVLITGMSGSGKSVALHALEDMGYYCIDNLPPSILDMALQSPQLQSITHMAMAVDVRSAQNLSELPYLLKKLQQNSQWQIKVLFLDADNDTLVRRFSETRRTHPLSHDNVALLHQREEGNLDNTRVLIEVIKSEREILAELREHAHVIDTSFIKSTQLKSYIKALVEAPTQSLVLVFESFAFKRGIPVDANYVLDVRMLANPHYETALRPLTGKDSAVADFLSQQKDVEEMQDNIQSFLNRWLPTMAQDHRSYVTVAIGCTGGQHRSVYLVEQLAAYYRQQGQWTTLTRHRELDAYAA